jgi:hypothetical protein
MSLIGSALSVARAMSNEPASGGSGRDLSVQELTFTVRELQRQVAKLTNMNVALFEMLKERLAITDQELIDKVQAIEKPVAPLATEAQTQVTGASCASCGKTYSKRNNRCLYCGHVNTRTSVF